MAEVRGHESCSVIDVTHKRHIGNLMQTKLLSGWEDGVLKLSLRVSRHVFVELLCLMQGDADCVDKLIQAIESLIFPEVELGHQIIGVHHAIVERPMIH
jgi:hypothetical protein